MMLDILKTERRIRKIKGLEGPSKETVSEEPWKAINPSLRCHIYLRVSGTEQLSSGNSIENQRAQCLAFAAQKGFYVREIYQEGAISGRRLDRPEFTRMREAMADGEHLIAYSISRISRSVKTFIDIVTWAERHSITMHTVTERIDTRTAYGSFITLLFSALAQLEADLTQERMAEQQLRLSRRGETMGLAKFGYRAVRYAEGQPMRLVPHPLEQLAITKMFLLRYDPSRLKTLWSFTQIGRHLRDSEGFQSRYKATFTGPGIRDIMIREFQFRLRVHGLLFIPAQIIQRYEDLTMPFLVPMSLIDRHTIVGPNGTSHYDGLYEDLWFQPEKLMFFEERVRVVRKKDSADIRPVDLYLMNCDLKSEAVLPQEVMVSHEMAKRDMIVDQEAQAFRALLAGAAGIQETSKFASDSLGDIGSILRSAVSLAEAKYRVYVAQREKETPGFKVDDDLKALDIRQNLVSLRRRAQAAGILGVS